MIQKTEGFVLKTYDFRETSKIALFYTKDFGKIKGILKGIIKNKKNFSTHLQPSSKNEIIFYPSRKTDLHLISRCDLIEDFPFLRTDLKRTIVSDCLLELINSIMPWEEKNLPIFNLLEFSLNALNKDIDPEMLWIFFRIKILKLTGFKPEIDSCLLCQKDLSPVHRGDDAVYFSFKSGGLLCQRCSQKDKDAKRLLKGAISSLLYMERINLNRIYSFKIDEKIKYELKDILKRFTEFHSEINIKSERFLGGK